MADEIHSAYESAQAHDEAFVQVLAHRTMLKAYILAIVHDPHLAEDTLSDTTLAIARSWEKFDRHLSFAPWARGIARRVALAILRKASRLIMGLDEDVMESLDSDFRALRNEAFHAEMRKPL